jgi:tripartite-type tricarboxylate transporter receptor subunit TctC
VALIAETPQVLVINPQLPFKSVAELVAYVKENPGKLNYSTGGIGTLPHLNAELFKSVSGANILHVPYKGGTTLHSAPRSFIPFAEVLAAQ